MAFTAKILSWLFRYLNIVGCLLKKKAYQGGGVTGTPGPPLPRSYAPGQETETGPAQRPLSGRFITIFLILAYFCF